MDSSLLLSFEKILCEIKSGDKYNLSIHDCVLDEIDLLSSHFSLSRRQVLLLTAVMDLCGFESVDCSKLSEALDCNFFSFLSMKQDLDVLRNRGLIEGTRTLSVPLELIDTILSNSPHTLCNSSNMSTRLIMEKAVDLYNAVVKKEKSPVSMLRAMDLMLLDNSSTSLAMACDRYGILSFNSIPEELSFDGECSDDRYTDAMSSRERILFYCLLANINDKVSWYDLSRFFTPMEIEQLQKSSREYCLQLQSAGVVDLLTNDCEYFTIRDNVKEQILVDVGGMAKNQYFPDIIRYETIKNRNLFYSKTIRDRVEELTNLLSESRFQKVRDSLSRGGLRTGFAVLFYGTPGTGKTETALQIAKSSSRDVIMVDVAELKNMYVGETEKNVRSIFERYRRYVADYGLFPILLFNEADAILGTRMNNPRGSADRAENSMQNIILEEMEKLDGILIATTNLSMNLDKAFDRRFLYRICFTQPDTEAMTEIFISMLPELTLSQAEELASEFPLSGGQIENVCRRKAVFTAITDRSATFEDIRRLCAEEASSSFHVQRIGF